MQKIILRLQKAGLVIGEWAVDDEVPLSVVLVDADSGLQVAGFQLTGPVLRPEVPVDAAPVAEVTADRPTFAEPDSDDDGRTDRFPEILQVRDLPDMENPPAPEDFDEGDTLVANAPAAAMAAASVTPQLAQSASRTLLPIPGEYDEVPVARTSSSRSAGDDLSLPVAMADKASARRATDDLSLSLEVSGRSVDRLPDDDFTMPMPEDGMADNDDVELLTDDSEPYLRTPATTEGGQRPETRRRSETIGSTTIHEAAEVWFRQAGEWIPRGTLTRGQHVQAFGGMVRCDPRGGLEVTSGARLAGSATLPSGESVPVVASREAVRFPPGTSIILWSGDLGFYVRSNVPPDAASIGTDDPATFTRPGLPPTWRSGRTDFDDGR